MLSCKMYGCETARLDLHATGRVACADWVQRDVQDLIKEAFQKRIRKGAAQTPESK